MLHLSKKNFLKFRFAILALFNLVLISCDDGPQRKRAALVLPTATPEQTSTQNCVPSKAEENQSLICSTKIFNETNSGQGGATEVFTVSIRVKNHTNFPVGSQASFTVKNSQTGEIETQSVGIADTWKAQGNLDIPWEIGVAILDEGRKTIGETKFGDQNCSPVIVGGTTKKDQAVEVTACASADIIIPPTIVPDVVDPDQKKKSEKTVTSIKLKVLN